MSKWRPRGAKGGQRGAKGRPRGGQGEAKRGQREAKGRPREAKGRPRGGQERPREARPGQEAKLDQKICFWEPPKAERRVFRKRFGRGWPTVTP